jgi:tripartite-type tricarboxylate transporter receptor subunit TctC
MRTAKMAANLGKIALMSGLLLGLHLGASAAPTEGAAEFYRGKTLSLYVGSTTGGAYDVYARLLARHIARHLPGAPRVVVLDMDGAGGLRFANYLYNAAPRDGTVIGTLNGGAPFEPLLGDVQAAKFDAGRFTWIGSASDEVSTCVVWKRTGITSFTELYTRPLTVGGTGAGADTNQLPKVLNGVFGTKIKIVSGYAGGNEIDLAMERGEVDGRCGWSWSSVLTVGKQWLDNGSIKVIVQLGLHGHPDLKGVPLVTDFAKTDEQRAILRLIFARNALAYPFLAPPGLPPERTATLRRAFDEAMADPALLAEARTAHLEIAPMQGAELEKLVQGIYRTPREVVAKARAIVK